MPIQRAKPRFTEVKNVSIATSLLPAGSILQVVQGETTAQFSTSSTSFVRCTNLSATITPSATSSKILIFVNGWTRTGTYTRYQMGTIFRSIGGASYADISNTGTHTDNTNNGFFRIYDHGTSITEANSQIHYVDSPSTTSACIYAPATRRGTDSTTVYFGDTDSRSTIILMEIKG